MSAASDLTDIDFQCVVCTTMYVVLNRSNPDQLIVSSIDSFLHQEASNFKLESTNQAGGLCRYTERARFCL